MQEPNKDRHTYADYITWDDDARYELIDGVAYLMAPGPSQEHQSISRELTRQFANFLLGKPCQVFAAPFDVRLNAANDDDTVVQPDLLIVCDRSKLDGKSCRGAPDMVIEIISPSTGSYDRVLKFNKYLQSGVREYWVVDPHSKSVSVHVLESGKYVTSAYGIADTAPVHVLEGCEINFASVFGE